MSTPFTYHLFHVPTQTHYYGVRYSKTCTPLDLWSSYFSSSRKILDLIQVYGKESFQYEIRKIFLCAADAIQHEQTVLRRLKVLQRSDWLNNSIGSTHRGGRKKGTPASNRAQPISEMQKEKIRRTRELRGLNLECGKRLQKFFGDRNPMRNKETIEKYRKQITGRRKKYNNDGSWSWCYPQISG
jgi:hypothetical protein